MRTIPASQRASDLAPSTIGARLDRLPPTRTVWRFVALTTLGSLVWNAVLIGAGWALGDNWDAISGWVGGASKVVLVAAVAGIAGLFLARRVRRGRRSASP